MSTGLIHFQGCGGSLFLTSTATLSLPDFGRSYSMEKEPVVYLIHLDRPIAHAAALRRLE